MTNLKSIKSPQQLNLLVAFFDLSGFTRLFEAKEDQDIFALMSEFFEFTGEIIEAAGGTVIKFIGDAGMVVFPEDKASQGIVTLKDLKGKAEQCLKHHEINCRINFKVHFGEVTCGKIGTKTSKNLDIYGKTVNVAATLPTNGFSISPQAFRQLDEAGRKLFKKHTPAIRYIPLEERHA
jgi:adenylate cyclase